MDQFPTNPPPSQRLLSSTLDPRQPLPEQPNVSVPPLRPMVPILPVPTPDVSRGFPSFVSLLPPPPPAAATTTTTSTSAIQPRIKPRQGKRRAVKKRRRVNFSYEDAESLEAVRSKKFNLTLDVQGLQQEINQLRLYKEMLRSQAVVSRHDREGSCVRTAREFHRLFRTWYHPDVAGIKANPNRISAQQQQEFLWSAMDQDIDSGDGIVGLSRLWKQMKCYSRFMKPLLIEPREFYTVQSGTDVLVDSRGDCRLLISRQTVEQVFPHALAYEHLVNQLTGQVLNVKFRMLFYFNEKQLIQRYVLDLSLATAFMQLLRNPQDVAMLMGGALIGSNYTIYVEEKKPKTKRKVGNPCN